MLKSLSFEDEGLQELINPVPLELVIDENGDFETEVEEMIARENEAILDVIDMLEDAVLILETSKQK